MLSRQPLTDRSPGACVDVSSLTNSSCWRSHMLRETLRPMLCLPNSLSLTFSLSRRSHWLREALRPMLCLPNSRSLFLISGGVQCYRDTLSLMCPHRTLTTDTCSCGLVQVFPFSRCVVRVLHSGFTQQGSTGSVPSSRGCASQVPLEMGWLRDSSYADLKHIQLPSREKGDVTRRHKLTHSTVTTPRHEHATH